MENIFETVLDLATAPFLKIPFLEKIFGYDEEMIDRYLQSRREDIMETIKRKYAIKP